VIVLSHDNGFCPEQACFCDLAIGHFAVGSELVLTSSRVRIAALVQSVNCRYMNLSLHGHKDGRAEIYAGEIFLS